MTSEEFAEPAPRILTSLTSKQAKTTSVSSHPSEPTLGGPSEPALGGEAPFIVDEDDRYSRVRLISWWRQERLATSKVLVVGVGALGNEVVKNLALIGVGEIWLVDYDTVEDSNLTRAILFRSTDAGRLKVECAARMVAEINPDCRIHAVPGDITMDVGLGLFAAMDVVMGCLDNREARLWVNRCCWKVGTPWVDAGIQEISGVVKVFEPPDSACYECGMSEMDYKLINLKYSCPLLKREDILQGKVPTAPTISSIVAGIETQEALKILHGLPIRSGVAMVYSGETNQFYTTAYQRREHCLSHETYGETVDLPLTSTQTTLTTLFETVAPTLGAGLTLHLDRDLLCRLDCPRCDVHREILAPLHRVTLQEGRCEDCGEVCLTDIVHKIRMEDRFAGRKLSELGIPPFDILRVTGERGVGFFRLEGDRAAVLS